MNYCFKKIGARISAPIFPTPLLSDACDRYWRSCRPGECPKSACRYLKAEKTRSGWLIYRSLSFLAGEAWSVGNEAERKKRSKYAHLEASHHFTLIAVETLGVLGTEARSFLQDLGRRLKDVTLEPLSHNFLLQRISVAVQRGNAAAIIGSRFWCALLSCYIAHYSCPPVFTFFFNCLFIYLYFIPLTNIYI